MDHADRRHLADPITRADQPGAQVNVLIIKEKLWIEAFCFSKNI
jgi:hypothetical protein